MLIFKANPAFSPTLYHVLRTWYPSGRFERLDFRGERENQMRDGIMSALQTLYHVLQTWYPSGGIGRLVFCGERRNQMRCGIMSVSRHYTTAFTDMR